MRKCCFIIPYYGKFPDYFPLFLHTCRWNEDFDWLFVTDIDFNGDCPDNVHWLRMSFDELKGLVQSKFDFKISLERIYKLCDFKPTYGYVFEEYLKDYKCWGHCDIDTIMGKINHFLTDELLDKYDKIFALGHFTVYRNTYENNRIFMKDINGYYPYREKLSQGDSFTFDEEYKSGNVNQIFLYQHKKVFCSDYSLCPHQYFVKFVRQILIKSPIRDDLFDFYIEEFKDAVYTWEGGCLKRYYCHRDHLVCEEFLYMHFLHRKMKNTLVVNKDLSQFKIVPNSFVPLEVEKISEENFGKIRRFSYSKYAFMWRLMKLSLWWKIQRFL